MLRKFSLFSFQSAPLLGSDRLKVKRRLFASGREEISLLGFGLLRLPRLRENKQNIDYTAACKMIDRAMEMGVNYFDTAWSYHNGQSEIFAGDALSRYPRGSYHLASKIPTCAMVKSAGDVEDIFESQLKKCKVDYFDFYLLHGLDEECFDRCRQLGIYEILEKKKSEGKIRYLGFSFHDDPEILKTIAGTYRWDFAQIQLNYLDWFTGDSRELHRILTQRQIPIIVMEPLRGGALAELNPEAREILFQAEPKASPASWALRFSASLPNVLCVLSGMSTGEQLNDNLATLTDFDPLSETEYAVLQETARAYAASETVPCSGCLYCGHFICPANLDIPRIFFAYNQYRLAGGNEEVFAEIYESIPPERRAHNCHNCRGCPLYCPQRIDIPGAMTRIAALAAQAPAER